MMTTGRRASLEERDWKEGDPTSARQPGRKVTVNVAESPLSWLHARGRISDRHYLAGEALRRDFEQAGLGPRVTMRWDPCPPSGSRRGGRSAPDPGLAQLSAKERFDGALAAAGSTLNDVLWRVVCAGEGLAMVEKGMGWPQRSGKLVLTIALDRVAAFYRIG